MCSTGSSKTSLQMELICLRNNPEQFSNAVTPNIAKLMGVKNTLAASSCTPERVFSSMNRVKTPYRSRLNDSRTAELVLLAHEKSLTNSLNVTEIVETYFTSKRRIDLHSGLIIDILTMLVFRF